MSVHDEVLNIRQTLHAEHNEESINTSNEEEKTPDQRLEEEEEGPTTSQATKQCGRSKVKRQML